MISVAIKQSEACWLGDKLMLFSPLRLAEGITLSPRVPVICCRFCSTFISDQSSGVLKGLLLSPLFLEFVSSFPTN